MTQPAYELDLRDLMDAYYGIGSWTQRTGIGIGTDIGPAISDGCIALRSQFGRGKIVIPPGDWLMVNPPSQNVLSGHLIEGIGSQASKVIYNNNSGVAFQFSGDSGYTGGGVKGLGILLESGLGNTNAYAIAMQGNATYQQDQTSFDDLYISAVGGSSYWWEAFHADGSARSSPQGCRVSDIRNMQVFNCRNIGIYLANAVQWTLDNVGAYTGAGPYGNSLMLRGGCTHIYGQGVNATIDVVGCYDVKINGLVYA